MASRSYGVVVSANYGLLKTGSNEGRGGEGAAEPEVYFPSTKPWLGTIFEIRQREDGLYF